MLGILARKTQPMQQRPTFGVGHPRRLGNHLRYPLTGPRAIKAGRLRALKQKLFQLLLVLGTQLTAPTRMRFGFQVEKPGLTRLGIAFQRDTEDWGSFDQASHFVDPFAFIKQRSRPLYDILADRHYL